MLNSMLKIFVGLVMGGLNPPPTPPPRHCEYATERIHQNAEPHGRRGDPFLHLSPSMAGGRARGVRSASGYTGIKPSCAPPPPMFTTYQIDAYGQKTYITE
jgi:hypothetical protein